MIESRKGDIFESGAQALVNPINCVGTMGAGLALLFKQRFPAMNAAYEESCRKGNVSPGVVGVHVTNLKVGPKYILNLPTKRHWRDQSRLEDIQSGLDALVGVIKALKIVSVAIPPLGCGLGGLDWALVEPEIVKRMAPVEKSCAVLVFQPRPTQREVEAKGFRWA